MSAENTSIEGNGAVNTADSDGAVAGLAAPSNNAGIAPVGTSAESVGATGVSGDAEIKMVAKVTSSSTPSKSSSKKAIAPKSPKTPKKQGAGKSLKNTERPGAESVGVEALSVASERSTISRGAVTPGRASAVKFKTSKTSLFADGYDIEGERLFLLPILNRVSQGEEIPASDPLFDRYMLYVDKNGQHASMARERSRSAEAPAQVTRKELAAYRSLGSLVNMEGAEDTVTIHTREAMQLFIGRAQDPDAPASTRNPIISFKKAGAAYRLLWSLSTNNNPYADWALLELTQRREQLEQAISGSVSTLEGIVEAAESRRGIKISISSSTQPTVLPLRFRSPYGYALVDCLAEFDYMVRWIRSLVFKGRFSTALADEMIALHMRGFRAHFNEVRQFEKVLGEADLMLCTRNDFLPTADDVARARIAQLVEVFGEVPRRVFEMHVVPKFKGHKSDLSEAEMSVLQKVTAGVMDDVEQAEASAIRDASGGKVI